MRPQGSLDDGHECEDMLWLEGTSLTALYLSELPAEEARSLISGVSASQQAAIEVNLKFMADMKANRNSFRFLMLPSKDMQTIHVKFNDMRIGIELVKLAVPLNSLMRAPSTSNGHAERMHSSNGSPTTPAISPEGPADEPLQVHPADVQDQRANDIPAEVPYPSSKKATELDTSVPSAGLIAVSWGLDGELKVDQPVMEQADVADIAGVSHAQPDLEVEPKHDDQPVLRFVQLLVVGPTAQPPAESDLEVELKPDEQPVLQIVEVPVAEATAQPEARPIAQPDLEFKLKPDDQPALNVVKLLVVGPTAQPLAQPDLEFELKPDEQPALIIKEMPDAQPSAQLEFAVQLPPDGEHSERPAADASSDVVADVPSDGFSDGSSDGSKSTAADRPGEPPQPVAIMPEDEDSEAASEASLCGFSNVPAEPEVESEVAPPPGPAAAQTILEDAESDDEPFGSPLMAAHRPITNLEAARSEEVQAAPDSKHDPAQGSAPSGQDELEAAAAAPAEPATSSAQQHARSPALRKSISLMPGSSVSPMLRQSLMHSTSINIQGMPAGGTQLKGASPERGEPAAAPAQSVSLPSSVVEARRMLSELQTLAGKPHGACEDAATSASAAKGPAPQKTLHAPVVASAVSRALSPPRAAWVAPEGRGAGKWWKSSVSSEVMHGENTGEGEQRRPFLFEGNTSNPMPMRSSGSHNGDVSSNDLDDYAEDLEDAIEALRLDLDPAAPRERESARALREAVLPTPSCSKTEPLGPADGPRSESAQGEARPVLVSRSAFGSSSSMHEAHLSPAAADLRLSSVASAQGTENRQARIAAAKPLQEALKSLAEVQRMMQLRGSATASGAHFSPSVATPSPSTKVAARPPFSAVDLLHPAEVTTLLMLRSQALDTLWTSKELDPSNLPGSPSAPLKLSTSSSVTSPTSSVASSSVMDLMKELDSLRQQRELKMQQDRSALASVSSSGPPRKLSAGELMREVEALRQLQVQHSSRELPMPSLGNSPQYGSPSSAGHLATNSGAAQQQSAALVRADIMREIEALKLLKQRQQQQVSAAAPATVLMFAASLQKELEGLRLLQIRQLAANTLRSSQELKREGGSMESPLSGRSSLQEPGAEQHTSQRLATSQSVPKGAVRLTSLVVPGQASGDLQFLDQANELASPRCDSPVLRAEALLNGTIFSTPGSLSGRAWAVGDEGGSMVTGRASGLYSRTKVDG